MQLKRGENTELKQAVADGFLKEVVAFVNSDGGALYIGVTGGGDIVGVSNPDEALIQVNNMMCEAIKPDITEFIESGIKIIDDRAVIFVFVRRGTGQPYYIAANGMRSCGVYIRRGAASAPVADAEIRRMVRETYGGGSYESARSLIQDLTFESAASEFKERGLEFNAEAMAELKLIDGDKIYTNLGLLFSDQCPRSVKIAVFQDGSATGIVERREFGGSLLKQLRDAFNYIDDLDFPQGTAREALINAVAHREYEAGGSILIKIFSDRIEFFSAGGLAQGLEPSDIAGGYSVCRNALLAEVFYRLKLTNSCGTGLPKIFEAYSHGEAKPKIEVTPNVFKITLPVICTAAPVKGPDERVLDLAREKGMIDRKDVESLLDISQTPAGQILKKLVDSGSLIKSGSGKNTKYLVVE